MSAFHVPSVPRGLLLPGLDTHEARNEEQADPTPAGSHWLFRPPPYISWADLRYETVTIHNPAAFMGSNLGGYTLSDRQKKHTYTFPPDCVANARASITLYCCPGKLTQREFDELPGNALLWTNQDGSLRRKEVLNDDGESVVLADALGKEVAVLEIPGQSDEDLVAGAKGVAYMKLPGVKRSQVLALRTLVLTLCYIRLACIAMAASRATVNPDMTLLAIALAHAFDILCRWASSQPGVPMDDFGVVLATMGDRLASLVILGSLVLLDTDERHRQLFSGMLALDITANWLQLSVASAAGGSRPLAGGAFVRGRGAAPDFATHLMLRHPLALTVVSLGNEAFLLWSYLAASSSLPRGLRSTLFKAGSFFTDGISYLMEGSYSRHGHVDSDGFTSDGVGTGEDGELLGEGEEHGGLATAGKAEGVFAAGGWGGETFSVAWKAVWMGLMVCCAARQLLSCIQALISMSTLSSGVIADAAGQDLQRRNGRQSSRGRAVDGGGGVSGGGTGSAGSRARSRSRVR